MRTLILLCLLTACSSQQREVTSAQGRPTTAVLNSGDSHAVALDAGTAPPVAVTFETQCNGVDDDGDGVIDVLLPLGQNACTTQAPGACRSGWAACLGGQKVCYAPPPLPEVFDGVDNDCNGVIDDVPSIDKVRIRALMVAPGYGWSDAASDMATTAAVLDQSGIPFDRAPVKPDWFESPQSIPIIDKYSLVVIPGYLMGPVIREPVRQALESFANAGGVVLVFKPIGKEDQPQALQLAGLRRSVRHRDVTTIRFDLTSAPIVASIDSPEEQVLEINSETPTDPVEVYAFEPDPTKNTKVIAEAYSGNVVTGATVTRRPIGRGAIYALGFDFSTFGKNRCYVNCFEPSGDVLRGLLQDAFREAALGHTVRKHTIGGPEDSALILTHDVDAPDAQNRGTWGEPGALQMATMERERGVRATYNVTTDYIAGYYNPQTIKALCAEGMCPLGAHSVRHSSDFGAHARGSCLESRGSYGPTAVPTLCGEVRVSLELLSQLTGNRPTIWRSPYFDPNPNLYDVLAKNGVWVDSSFAVGDLKYNLPVNLENVGFRQPLFHKHRIYEFPVAIEDGLVDTATDARKRIEVQPSNLRLFLNKWQYLLMRNAHNGSITNALIHPSRGLQLPEANLQTKVAAVGSLIDLAKAQRMRIDALDRVADFWRARDKTTLEATYNESTGYAGTINVGAYPIANLTLEFGDMLGRFTCVACNDFEIVGKRVVIRSTLRANGKFEFTASVKR